MWRGFHPDGRPYEPHEWPLARAITTGEVVSGEEIHIERMDGKRLALLVSAAPIRNRLGNILAGIVVDQDITEHKQTSDALKNSVHLEQQARHEAEQANKFKDQFIAMVSHELRTPLTPVVMSLAALELDPHLPEDLQDEVAMLRRNVGIETKLIDDLLDVTSIANGKFRLDVKPTSIHALLRDVAEIVGGDAEIKCQKLTLELAAQDDTVGGDPVRLHQVFWNILKNAIKFTPCGGEIWIRTLNPRPAAIAIEVQDGGVGIAAQALPRIFGAFEQADQSMSRQFGGLGIGLTICKAIVDLHGGSIHAESAGPGKGARFRVELPVTRDIEEVATKIPDKVKKTADSIRVLVVDDHEDTLRVLRRLLESLGYRVATAGSATAALNYVAANEVDVLVSDIGLPDASGHDLVRQVKKIRNVPAVAISGFGSATDIQNSRDAGFYAHLTKPLDFDLLHATIQQARAGLGILVTMLNLETGTRGYVITGEELYLEPYRNAVDGVSQQMTELSQAIGNAPEQQERFKKLAKLVAAELAIEKRHVELRQKQDFEAASRDFKTGDGIREMDQIREVVADIVAEQDELMSRQSEQVVQQARQTTWTIGVGGVCGFLFVAGLGVVIHRDLGRRREAAEQLGQSEERYRQWFERDGLRIIRPRSARANRNMERRRPADQWDMTEIIGISNAATSEDSGSDAN